MIVKSLSPNAQHAVRLIKALRALPQTSGTIAAEKRTLIQLNLTDLCAVSLALQAEAEGTRG
jgi:hypothetical protein